MRTIFLGTPEIAVPTLERLASLTEVSLVITQPDRPAGRGRQLSPPPVKVAAERLGIPVFQPERLRAHADDPRLQGADLWVVLAYGEILTQRLLDLPPLGCINLHASLLPQWRGASPLQAAIRAGDTQGGVTVMRMVKQLDAGPVYLQRAVPLPPDITLPQWHDQVAQLNAEALEQFLSQQPWGEPVPQEEAQATFCGKLTSDDGRLDFSRPAADLERQIRAYTPAPGCWCLLGAERLRIQAARVREGLSGRVPGSLVRQDKSLLVVCGTDALELLRVQAPSSRALDVADFLNGYAGGRALPDHLH